METEKDLLVFSTINCVFAICANRVYTNACVGEKRGLLFFFHTDLVDGDVADA